MGTGAPNCTSCGRSGARQTPGFVIQRRGEAASARRGASAPHPPCYSPACQDLPTMKRTFAAPVLVAGLSLLALSAAVYADNWPQWRGPNGDGVSKEKNLPTKWSETENVAWKLPLPGMGGATPVVWGDKIFLTSEDGSSIDLLCVSTAGKELWKKKLGSSTSKARSDEGNGASASPSTDGKSVFAFAGSGELAAFDFTGKELWSIDLQ